MREGRLNFSDYSAKEQERDERKNSLQDVYIMKVSGIWSAYVPRKSYPISLSGDYGEEMQDFYKNIKEILEKEFKMKVRIRHINNAGIEEYLRKQIEIHKLYSPKAYRNEY